MRFPDTCPAPICRGFDVQTPEERLGEAVRIALTDVPLIDGAYAPEQLARALRIVMRDHGADLQQVATGAAQKDGPCAPHFCRYAFLAYEDAHVSAWLLGWPENNPGTEIHDHNGSAAAIAVVAGDVLETVFTDHGTATVRRLLAGRVVRIPRDYIHKFEDAADAKGESLSLHLYSPPLRRMNFYGFTAEGAFVRDGFWAEEPAP